MKASILISSYNRLPLFRRTLHSIATHPPNIPFEVVVADESSTEDIKGELEKYSSKFPWVFVTVDDKIFTEKTGLKKFHNNPSVTNNIAFKHASGDMIFQQGNEIITTEGAYSKMLADAPLCDHWMVMSTTYDFPQHLMDLIDLYGSNILPAYIDECKKWPLQSKHYRSDVTNYVSLAPRAVWEGIKGYNEQYFGGISAEDSDFVRRARCLPDFEQVISDAVTLHQYHQGKTRYYDPPPSVITKERWDQGVRNNHQIFHNEWDGTANNPQEWPWGEYGVVDVVRSGQL